MERSPWQVSGEGCLRSIGKFTSGRMRKVTGNDKPLSRFFLEGYLYHPPGSGEKHFAWNFEMGNFGPAGLDGPPPTNVSWDPSS